MAKIYNIDSAIEENRPIIRLRGKEYVIRDLSVKEMLSYLKEASQKEKKIAKRIKDRIRKTVKEEVEEGKFSEEEIEDEVEFRAERVSPEQVLPDFLPYLIDMFIRFLREWQDGKEGEAISKELLESLTIKEIKFLKQAITKANNQLMSIDAEENDDLGN